MKIETKTIIYDVASENTPLELAVLWNGPSNHNLRDKLDKSAVYEANRLTDAAEEHPGIVICFEALLLFLLLLQSFFLSPYTVAPPFP